MAVPAAAPRLKARLPPADPLPWIAAAVYAALYFSLGILRYGAHRNFVDLGIFAQTAASAFGCFCNTVEGSHWAVHFSPILYLAGALLRVWHSAIALVALQSVAGALTIPPVYALVYRYTDSRAARLAAFLVFFYPPLAGVIFNDFHENGFAPAAIAWLFWAYDGGNVIATFVFAAVALSIKEDQAAFLCIGGILGFIRYRGTWPRGPLAAAIAVLSAAVLLKFFLLIQPAAAAHAHWAPTRFYHWTAHDLTSLPAGILMRIGFVLLAFVPLLFLPFRVSAGWLLAAPLAEVLLSRDATTFSTGSHYAGAWCGYAFYAFAVALRPIYARDPVRVRRILAWCIGLGLVEFAVANPLHPGYFLHLRSARDAHLDAFLKTLPRDAGVATQEEAYTHLAATDPNATVLPETAQGRIQSCEILTDTDFPESPRLVESAPLLRSLVQSGVYRVAQRDGGITLYTSSTMACR